MNHSTYLQRRWPVAGLGAAMSLAAGLTFAAPASAQPLAPIARSNGVLTVSGDSGSNAILVSRDRAGTIEVNGRAVTIRGVRATVTNVRLIDVLGGPGSDRLAIDESNGTLPRAHLSGGAGDDELFGGSRRDLLSGGGGNDTLAGGGGTDQVLGDAGNDQLVWNPGDGSDVDEGGSGSDAIVVNGGAAGESFAAAADGSRVRFDRLTPSPFSLDIGTSERLVLNAGDGDDSFVATGDLAPLIGLTVNGGSGNDRISVGNGNDILDGGTGDDTVDGNQGSDTAFLGDGSDTFVWDAGDGSDTVEGEAGADTLVFNGAAADENVDVSANGSRTRLVRDVGHVSMDLNGIEQVDTNALAGADTITVNDLSGTDVTGVDIGLAGPDPKAGDGAHDQVVVAGTDGADTVRVAGSQADGVTLSGLQAVVRVFGSDGPTDALAFNALGGDDTVDATGLAEGAVSLTVDGGAGTDVLSGRPGTVLIQ